MSRPLPPPLFMAWPLVAARNKPKFLLVKLYMLFILITINFYGKCLEVFEFRPENSDYIMPC